MRRVTVLSLEPWDDVWRRNQHFAAGLVAGGAVAELTFVEPPVGGFAGRATRRIVRPGITAVTPPLVVPRRYGGHRVLAAWLRREVAGSDVVWVNDPVAGAGSLRPGTRALYDVTDDWRVMPQADRERRRIIAAEDALARLARTVVCSPTLAQRWHERYGLAPRVVPNGVDVAALGRAIPIDLDDAGPHLIYVGTLHANRIDVALVRSLVRVGTVHLVGPNGLSDEMTRELRNAGVQFYGAVNAAEVPRWLLAADVLICPHLVDEFTLSLNAIKAHEYLASDRPVVATPSCGFESLTAVGLTVAAGTGFISAARDAVGTGPFARTGAVDWTTRVEAFTDELVRAVSA